MKGFEYEYILRRNYEMWAFLVWVAGGLAVYILYLRLDLPVIVFQIMGLVCASMGLGRGLAAIGCYRKNRRLQGGKTLLEFFPWEALRRKVRKEVKDPKGRKERVVWLGTGFPWTQGEVQKATDILNTAPSKLFQDSEGKWIHGLGVHKSQDLTVPVRLLEGHTLVVGSTGTGKTRLFDLLIAQAIMRGETVIIIDPKGDQDLAAKTRLACERMGTLDRYLFFHPAFSRNSVRLDPMKNWHRATELASRVGALIPSETKVDPFQAFGWMALNSIIQGLVYLEREPNLLKLRRYVERGPEDILWPALHKYFAEHWPTVELKSDLPKAIEQYKKVSALKPELAVEGLVSQHLHNREHFQKMVSSLIPILSMLTAGDLQYLLSPEPHDGDTRPALNLTTVIEKNGVLYVGLDSLSDPTVGSAIGSILLADLTAVASDRYNYGQSLGRPPVNVFIDEAGEVVNDPAIQLLNKSRGAGFRVVIATQTLADLEVRTGTEAGARQVIGNTNNWIFFRVIDGQTQKYISEALPKTAVKALDQGYRSASRSDDPAQFTGMYTESLRETPTELFPAAMLGILPTFHYFCRMSNGTTWKGKLPIIEYERQVRQADLQNKAVRELQSLPAGQAS